MKKTIAEQAANRYTQLYEYTFKRDLKEADDDSQVDNTQDATQPEQTQAPSQPETQESGTEEIDVTELTDKQNEIDQKLTGVSQQFVNLVNQYNTLVQKVDAILTHSEEISKSTDAKIESLQQEIEKRVPTEIEKLNLRSMDSAPFSEKPADFWNQKNEEGRYGVYSDNKVDTADDDKEYVLRQSDLDKEHLNPYLMAKSLTNDEYNQSLSNILNF